MNRKTISKRVRFEVFARDNFTCKYCGRQSDAVPLHIDHVVPVCEGGTNDIENLITACADCNLGKGGKKIEQHAPTESDRLRLAQERNEQIAVFNAARESMRARQELRQSLVDFWCEQTGRSDADGRAIATALSFCEQFGVDVVMGWIEKAARRTRGDTNIIKYVSGIRRNVLKEAAEEATHA